MFWALFFLAQDQESSVSGFFFLPALLSIAEILNVLEEFLNF